MPTRSTKQFTPAMQVVVTLVFLLSCLLVILSDSYDPASKNWAFATAGTISRVLAEGPSIRLCYTVVPHFSSAVALLSKVPHVPAELRWVFLR
jgi:hypothetical protein